AISRRHTRHRPNFRYTECGRPQRWHRVYARTANFGLRFALLIKAFFAISYCSLLMVAFLGSFALRPAAPSSPGRPLRSLTSSLLLEREAQVPQQRPALLVARRRRHHGDVHTADPVDLVLVDLVEHRLLVEAERVVAVPVELPGAQPAEVADARQRDGHESVE